VLGLYREVYPDFTVKHFHEQVQKRHNYKLGYTVTRLKPASGRFGAVPSGPDLVLLIVLSGRFMASPRLEKKPGGWGPAPSRDLFSQLL